MCVCVCRSGCMFVLFLLLLFVLGCMCIGNCVSGLVCVACVCLFGCMCALLCVVFSVLCLGCVCVCVCLSGLV